MTNLTITSILLLMILALAGCGLLSDPVAPSGELEAVPVEAESQPAEEAAASGSTTIYTMYKESGSRKWTVVAALLPLVMGLVATLVVAQEWRITV